MLLRVIDELSLLCTESIVHQQYLDLPITAVQDGEQWLMTA